MKNQYKIVVLDLDGTLMDSRKELSERNQTALIRLQQQGVKVVLASGRPTYGIVPIAKALEMERYGGYILAFNGGSILSCEGMECIYSQTLPQRMVAPLHEASEEAGCTLLSYEDEFIITERADDRYVGVESHLNKMAIKELPSLVEHIQWDVPKCLAVGEPEQVVALEAHLKSLYGEMMGIYRSEPFFLELVPLHIDKANSLQKLLEHLGCCREEMMAFGDGFNDLSMIEFAGHGVAMANGQPIVRERAQAVTLTNDEDGVAHYIEEHLL